MKSEKKFIWIYVAAILVISANVVTLFLLWQKNDHGRPPDKPHSSEIFDFLSSELKFSDAQRKAYAVLRDEHHTGAMILEDSLRIARESLFEMVKSSTAEELKSRNEKVLVLVSQLNLLNIEHFKEVRVLCNDDQKNKFDIIIREALRMRDRDERRGPPPGR